MKPGSIFVVIIGAVFVWLITSKLYGKLILRGGLQFTRLGHDPALFDQLRFAVRTAGITLVCVGVLAGPSFGLVAAAVSFLIYYRCHPSLSRWQANVKEDRKQRHSTEK